MRDVATESTRTPTPLTPTPVIGHWVMNHHGLGDRRVEPSRDFASWSHGVMETLSLIYRLLILLTTFRGLIRRFQPSSDIS